MSFIALTMDIAMSLMKQTVDSNGNRDYAKERERNAKTLNKRVPKSLSLTLLDNENIQGEMIAPNNPNGTIMYIHGGGYTTGSAKERRDIAIYLAKKYQYRVVSVNYRLAPEHKWPSQLEDCYRAYQYICNNITKDIVLMGESAGGELVLALGLYIKDQKYNKPKAIVSFSPITNQVEHYPSHSQNIKTDKMLRDSSLKGYYQVLFDEEPSKEQLASPYLSPILGNYKDMPPIFLSASESETLFDDSKYLFEKLMNEKHKVGKDFQKKVCHAYQIFPFVREARKSIKACIEFLEELD